MKKRLMAAAIAAVMIAQPTVTFATSPYTSTGGGLCSYVPQWHWTTWLPCH